MSKIIKAVLLIAVAIVLVVYAAPLVALIGGQAFALGTAAAAIVSTITAVGISLGLSALGSLFRKAPALSNANVDRLNASVIPSAPRKFIFGTTAAGSDIRFFETYGSDKSNYVMVVALASHQLHAIKSWYGGSDLTWTASGDGSSVDSSGSVAGSIVKNSGGFNSIRAVAIGLPGGGRAIGSQSLWTSAATFTGCAYLVIDFKLDSKIWPSGIPQQKMTTIVDGCPLYDPRLDTTAGGSGPHRIADQTTWSFLNNSVAIGRNPALAMLAYLIGWRVNGRLMWGMGVPATAINLENFKEYANICEEDVLLADGLGTVQRYTCDGIFSTSDTHETVINAISATMGSCKLSDVGGRYGFLGGYDDSMGVVQAFYEDDIVGGVNSPSPYHWQPAGTTSESYNVVEGRFADPAQLYQLVDWGTIEIDALPDNIRRSLTLDLGCVNRAATCQRIGKQNILREALAQGVFSCTMGPRAFIVEVGSLVSWTVPSLGWQSKLFRVQEQREVLDMIYSMTFREENPMIYEWDGEETAQPLVVTIPGYDASYTVDPVGMSLTSITYEGVGQ